jgi:putative endopeptidase
LKNLLAAAASLAALSVAAPAPADVHDHACLNEACTMVSLFEIEQTGGAAGAADPTATQRMGPWGFDLSGMDRSVKPGDDWFNYVNGTWAANTPIPADKSSYGGFAILRDLSEVRVRKLVEGYEPAAPGDAGKVARLYASFMDQARADRLDMQPIRPRLNEIRAIRTKEAMARDMGAAFTKFGSSFFGAFVNDDSKNPDFYALYMGQSGLGLGDRELYLQEQHAGRKARYQQYVGQMLDRIGWPNADRVAADVVAMETRIAQAHWTRAESRDRDKTYNLTTIDELESQAPGFPWRTFLNAAGLARADKAIVAQNTAFPKIAAVFAETPLETLKAWQAFRVADSAAPYLSERFVQAQFEFRGKYLNGTPQLRERWKRGVSLTEGAMGEAIGRDYVELYFPPESKAKMDRLVADLRTALQGRIDKLEWMGPETKAQAQAKLAKFGVKIGYPDKWRDYSGLDFRADDLVGNVERASRFEWNYRIGRLGQRVDELEWGMTPQTVNAYYSPPKNEIVFPAAILQPPFFDPDADPAVNYGAIGGVIGHEFTHGFDDQGRKSDGDGRLRDWWTAEDAARFEAEAAKLGAQYESVEFPNLPGMKINGRVSMGENIADLGGVLMAHDAYRLSLGGEPAPVLDGFTGDQRLFLAWGQVWRTLWRDEALRQQLINGPHSPGQVRAVNPLRNIDAWYDAFGVKEGDAHYIKPEDRVRIW